MTHTQHTTSFSSKLLHFLGIDISHLLWLSTSDFLPAKPVNGAECRVLSTNDIQMLSKIKDFGLSDESAAELEAQNGLAVGIFVNDKLAGISLFLANNIPGNLRRKNPLLLGSTISLPPGTRYLHKALVLPEHRGQRLHSAMVRFAISHLGTDTVHTIVTTANVVEKSFLSSILQQGFEKVGWTAEGVLFGKHFYRLPKPVDSLNGKTSTEEDGCVVIKAATA